MTSLALEKSSHDPNTIKAQDLGNSWRCYLVTLLITSLLLL